MKSSRTNTGGSPDTTRHHRPRSDPRHRVHLPRFGRLLRMRLHPAAPRNVPYHTPRLRDRYDCRVPPQLAARGGLGAGQDAHRSPTIDAQPTVRLPGLRHADDAPGLHGLPVPLRHAPPVAVTERRAKPSPNPTPHADAAHAGWRRGRFTTIHRQSLTKKASADTLLPLNRLYTKQSQLPL